MPTKKKESGVDRNPDDLSGSAIARLSMLPAAAEDILSVAAAKTLSRGDPFARAGDSGQ